METDLLTAQEVAQILRVHLKTVYLLADSEKLPVVRIGRIVRFPRSAIEAMLKPGLTESRELNEAMS